MAEWAIDGAGPKRRAGQAWRWSLTLLYLAALLTGTHLPEDHAALATAIDWAGGDKMAHFLGYLGLAWLVLGFCRAGGSTASRWATRWGIAAALAVLGGIDELTQPYVGRPAEWGDWFADLSGLGLAALLTGWSCKLRNSSMWKWAILLTAALGVRLAVWAWFADIAVHTFDEHEFSKLAVNLVERGEFAVKPGELTSKRPPLYPGLVALIYSGFGVKNFQAVRLVQIALNLVTVIVIYGLCAELFSQRAGFWAAALCAFYPSLWGHDYLLLTEVPFTLLLSVGAYCMVRHFKQGAPGWAGLGGIVLGLAALTRSVLWLFPPWLVLIALFDRRRSWSSRLTGIGVFLGAFAATLAPWAVRNTRLQGTLTIVDSTGGHIIRWAWSAHEPSSSSPAPDAPRESEGERDQRAVRDAVRSFFERPALVLERVWYHTWSFWGLERELASGAKHGHFGELPPRAVVALAAVTSGYYALLMGTALVGLFTVRPANRAAGLFVLIIIAHIFAVHALVFGHSRYHIPVVALLTVFSGAACAMGRSLFLPELRLRLWMAAGVFAVLTASWIYLFVTKDSAVLFQS